MSRLPLPMRKGKWKKPTQEGVDLLLFLYDAKENLIAWCGPYSSKDYQDAIRLFREGGWGLNGGKDSGITD